MENQFLKQRTRTNCVIYSVLSGIALITLIMISLLVPFSEGSKAFTCFLYTISIVFLSTIWMGALQIKVFNDYKNQRKSLCAEGIFVIVLAVLIIICGILFYTLQIKSVVDDAQLNTIDIRYFISIFLIVFAVWKGIIVYLSLKEKRFNWWLELIISICWLAFAGLTIAIILVPSTSLIAIEWAYVAIGWIMIVAYVTYQLYSYIFKSPDYLITDEGLLILEKENAEKSNRMARLNAITGVTPVGSVQSAPTQQKVNEESLESKLEKLETLKSKGVITEEEYKEKRKKIIDQSL